MPLTTDTQTFAVSKENALPVICVALYLDADLVWFLQKKVIQSLDFLLLYFYAMNCKKKSDQTKDWNISTYSINGLYSK